MSDHKRDARRAIEDLDLDARLAKAGAAASQLAQEAVTTVGGFAREHRDQAHGWLGRAEDEVDRVTGGRGHDVVAKVRSGLAAGVDLVAEQGSSRDPDEPSAEGEER
ncbi:hypothetical protein [Janibacter sp. GS2]|uniref:hypothetical protein n=1 Tax=Janibacter sp. GS2 TaxID=3442646 RepID=UPI003EBDE30B